MNAGAPHEQSCLSGPFAPQSSVGFRSERELNALQGRRTTPGSPTPSWTVWVRRSADARAVAHRSVRRQAARVRQRGSAGNARHLATELVVRYEKERAAIAAVALTADSLLRRPPMISGSGTLQPPDRSPRLPRRCRRRDSTSGRSPNVLAGCARRAPAGCTAGLIGRDGGDARTVRRRHRRAFTDHRAHQECICRHPHALQRRGGAPRVEQRNRPMSDRHCWTYWPSFHRARVLVLGDVMLDRFVYGSVDRTRPRPRRDGARAHL